MGTTYGLESGIIAGLVQKHLDQTGKLPGNWSEIWSESDIFFMKVKNPDRDYAFHRFLFVKADYPMVPEYQGSLVEGKIIILLNEPIRSESQQGEKWRFLWLDKKNKVRLGVLDEKMLSIGNEPGKIQLKDPDIKPEQIASVTKKLADAGFKIENNLEKDAPLALEPLVNQAGPTEEKVRQLHAEPAKSEFSWFLTFAGIVLAILPGFGLFWSVKNQA